LNILFYTPFSSRSRDTESLMEAFAGKGHNVFLLTQTPRGVYHEACEKAGVKTFSKEYPRSRILYFIRHAWYLRKFCREKKIDVVYAHLENAALPAVIAGYFMSAKVFGCRHIVDEAYLMASRRFILLNRIVYRLARRVIVVSDRSKAFMVEKEGIRAEKIRVIRLGYNFSLYDPPSAAAVALLQARNPSGVRLVTACRLMRAKRPDVSLQVLRKLLDANVNATLFLLGTGPMEAEVAASASAMGLTGRIFIEGHRTNVQDYLAASHFLIHPSLQDSSSVIVKEAGLQRLPVIVCRGIGDVDEYLRDGENAFLVSTGNTVEEMTQVVLRHYENKPLLSQVGERLRAAVLERFDISVALQAYEAIHRELNK
jgi:glycosyltransferase involved in cell wall biosynthesis